MASSRVSSSATSGGRLPGHSRNRTGRFEAAHGGSLFLDEIGDISPATQIRLLRILETKCVEPVGSHRARPVDVRLLAATNKPLCDEVGAGRFRRDLYYRLNVAMIGLPPLRERREDIPLLAGYFLDELRRRDELGRRSRRGAREIGAEAMEVLMHHGWPGNVRELRNAIEYASVQAQTDWRHMQRLGLIKGTPSHEVAVAT
jgi:two-component system response regulator HydG